MAYDGLLYSILSTVFIVGVTFYYWLVPSLNNKLLFFPQKVSPSSFNDLFIKNNKIMKKAKFVSKDKTALTGALVNTNKEPEWSDTIFMYSHGNGSWIGPLIHHSTIKLLSKFGSVFLYDYRGYGASDGNPSETGLYSDAIGAWNFLTKDKNIPSEKIIIFGHSLGSSVSSHLVSHLVRNNKKLPRGLILEAPFSTLEDIANHMYPPLSSLVMYEFNNLHNVKKINKSVPTCILHSKTDETIPYNHSIKIQKNTDCNMIEITGTHCDPIYNSNVDDYILSLIKT